jgi:cysteine-rich repeat protein
MRTLRIIAVVTLFATTGCAGCLGLGDLPDDDARPTNGGEHDPWDAGDDDDAGGEHDEADAGGADDPDDSEDAGADSGSDGETNSGEDAGRDTGPASACGNGDVEATETCDDGNTDDGDYCAADCSAETGSCGDGTRQSNETCDDGATTDCNGTHDGGDGSCVPIGECSPEYVLSGEDCVPEVITQHVHIYVANDCTMQVDPEEFTVPKGQKVRFEWHNHSADWEVDVWQSYIGGFTDLPPGQTWEEQFEWCANVNPYTGYSDISTVEVCPDHRFYIRCNGQ